MKIFHAQMRTFVWLPLSFSAWLALAPTLNAEPITFSVEGTVNSVDDALTGTFSLGDAFRLQYTFESTTQGFRRISCTNYPVAITALSVRVGHYSATSSSGFISLCFGSGGDRWNYFVGPSTLVGAAINGYTPRFGQQVLFLGVVNPNPFPGDDLPLAPLEPADYTSKGLKLRFCDENLCKFVDASVDSFSFAEPEVAIDIKPGSDPNSVNPKSKGVIPVAILGSGDLDALQVDVSTVEFGPSGAAPAHDGHVEDVNADTLPDRVFHFRTQDTGISCGDTEATLSGETFGGDAVTGTDSVKTAGCK